MLERNIVDDMSQLKIKKLPEFILDRSESYIGVMIDDLITKGVSEPYRMFTSRAEYRLSLRADNADQRLTPFGIKINLVKNSREKIFLTKQKKINQITKELKNVLISPNAAQKYSINIAKDGVKRSAIQVLGLKGVDMKKIREIWPQITQNEHYIDNQVEINAHYSGYLVRQSHDINAFKKDENILMPEDINYESFSSLSNEIKSKLIEIRPKTLGQALRIDGVTPAAAIILLNFIKRRKLKVHA